MCLTAGDRWKVVCASWVLLAISGPLSRGDQADAEQTGLAPIAIAAVEDAADGDAVAVLGSTGRRLILLDRSGACLRSVDLPAVGSGLAVYGTTAYVTTAEPAGRVLIVDLQQGTVQRELRVGHMPLAPTLDVERNTLYVANRFDHTVGIVDLQTGQVRTVGVVREPVALAVSTDGRRLFAANHLPCVRPFLDDENPFIAAEVSVIDIETARLLRNIELPNGSQSLRGIALSPDGRYLAVTHVLSNYTLPTLQVEGGAMNRNAVSLLDAVRLRWVGTAILDDPERGAANPWAVAFCAGGDRLLVTHAGTQELSVIDFPALLARATTGWDEADLFRREVLDGMQGIRTRVALPIHGPRALLVQGDTVWIPGYFSDDLAVVQGLSDQATVRAIPLGTGGQRSLARLGEQYFHDAGSCLQAWQSCASCHPDGRSDTLYWDLLNDGVGNTKNTKSLLMSALTPPVMWRGVRSDSRMAVRSGIHHIQFAEPRPDQVDAIEQYLLGMPAVPGPALNADVLESPKTEEASCAKCHYPGVQRGTLTEAAARGKAIFQGRAGCAACHPHPLFTSMDRVDPGLGSGVQYDVPSLVEVWRTAPYLHSGDALSLRETITDHNLLQKRGATQHLTERELDDLVQYLRSL
jgi:DNA-binding beta-propeller fold protein YncE